MSLENLYKNLSDEQKAKAKACKSTEDLIEMTKKEGISISRDELEAIAGGNTWDDATSDPCKRLCPKDSKAWS